MDSIKEFEQIDLNGRYLKNSSVVVALTALLTFVLPLIVITISEL